jgi:hypothetical protein
LTFTQKLAICLDVRDGVFVCGTCIKGEHDAEGKLEWYFGFDYLIENPWEGLRIFEC